MTTCGTLPCESLFSFHLPPLPENQWGAAVAALNVGSEVIRGVVRMVQTSEDKCVFEGTVDGLPPGQHALCVHETGDISSGCVR